MAEFGILSVSLLLAHRALTALSSTRLITGNFSLQCWCIRARSFGLVQGTARLSGQGGLIAAFLVSLFPIADAMRAGFALAALWTLAAGAISWNRRGGQIEAIAGVVDLASGDINVRSSFFALVAALLVSARPGVPVRFGEIVS